MKRQRKLVGPVPIQCKFVILWADELQAASKALQAINALPEDAPVEEWREAVRAALDACSVALNGADDEESTLLLNTKPNARKP